MSKNKFTTFLSKNKSSIFTGLGLGFLVSGVVVTYVESPKSHTIHEKYKELAKKTKDKKERRKLVVKEIGEQTKAMAPSIILVGAGTGFILAGKKIDVRNLGTMGFAYEKVLERRNKELEAAKKVLTQSQKKEIDEEVAKNEVSSDKKMSEITENDYAAHSGLYPCKNSFTGKIGWTSYEKLERAILKASSRCQSAGDVCVNEFFDETEVPEWELVPVGEKWGWEDADLDKGILPITISSIVVDGRPCLYLDLDRYAHKL